MIKFIKILFRFHQVVKTESEQVTRELSTSSERVNKLVSWLNDATKRLHLLNKDDDAQLKVNNIQFKSYFFLVFSSTCAYEIFG